jgi:SAM-dependent methyltransferase
MSVGGRLWDDRRVSFEADAAVYDRHVGRYAAELSAAHIAAARVARGDHVLDVGCGPGGLTRALADLVGAENVAAVDPSKSFVAACGTRVPGADVREGAAESLPFEDGAFDVVLSQLVVNFMRDADAGLAEMRRVARGGGSVASCVWDYADGMTMLRAFWDGALDLDPDAPDEARTMRYCSEPELRDLWLRGGLHDVDTGVLVVEAAYDNFDDYWAPFPTGLAPSGAYCASLDAERQEAFRAAVFRRLGEPAGPFTLTARAWFVNGSVP